MSPLTKLLAQGIEVHRRGDLDGAIDYYKQILETDAKHPDAWHLYGTAMFQKGLHGQALQCVQQAIMHGGHLAPFMNTFALILRAQGRLHKAEETLKQGLETDPNQADVLSSMGLVQAELGRLHESIAWLKKALAVRPNDTGALINMANAYNLLGLIHDAAEAYRRAIRLNDKDPIPYSNLGVALNKLGHLDEAILNYRKALKINPNYVDALNNLGLALLAVGQHPEAAVAFRKSLKLQSSPRTYSNYLLCLTYHKDIALSEMYDEHIRWANAYAVAPATQKTFPQSRDPERKLRVGYVSPDFREHAVARFVEPLFRNHDRSKVELFAYAEVSANDQTTVRLHSLVPNWRSTLGLSDDEMEATIRHDQIDILIDLAGHTGHNRLPIFARKPAPVQLSMIGYPATTGIKEINYRITDEVLHPLSEPSFHAEQLYRPTVGTACFSPGAETPEVGPLPALRNGYITLGSPHNLAKMSPEVYAAWSAILKRLPTAKLLLFREALAGNIAASVKARFAEHGISEDRLDIRNVSVITHGYMGYMNTYNEVDFCLDTFPANAGTTAFESLFMGTPMLTLYGDRFFGRQTASVLSRVGMQDWIARSPEEYVEKAVSWSQRLNDLGMIRSQIRGRIVNSPVGNPKMYTQGLEESYRDMWRKWCATR